MRAFTNSLHAPGGARGAVALAVACALAWAAGVGAGPARAAEDPPRVVASIKPVHALVAGVMAGVGEPVLIVKGAGSPHTYSLRPSDARALSRAQIVFWIGPTLELFLRRPLDSLARGASVVSLAEARGVVRLPQRAGGAWGEDPDAPGGVGTYNAHLWLDPRNAEAMVEAIADVLAHSDPAHRDAYRTNAARLHASLRALDAELARRLAPLRERPYLVFHDAYPYFEARYHLNAVGSVAVDPEQAPGARRIAALRRRIRAAGVQCVFAEPEFPPRLVRTLIEGTGARSGVLDPLGAELADGPALYPTLLRGLAAGLEACLGAR